MMKRVLLGFLLLISGFFVLFNKTKVIDSENLAVYVNNELVSSIPKKGEAMFIKSVCDNDVKASWDNDNWGLMVTNMSKKTKCNLYFYSGDTVFNFDYTGSEQVFTVPVSGTYKLETWGAQGGDNIGLVEDLGNIYDTENQGDGGTGGYATGIINGLADNKLFINVGGKGSTAKSRKNNENYLSAIAVGGYNGGGASDPCDADGDWYAGSGGGATQISIKSGVLSDLENNQSDILIVSGGGGGNFYYMNTTQWKHYSFGGSGGGANGQNTYHLYSSSFPLSVIGYGGKQNASNNNDKDISSGTFGRGATHKINLYHGCSSGGGGGYYGGSSTFARGAGGGSGYIGNSLLKDKAMYCYNCEESNEEDTKTISTTCSEETPTEKCAKKGNGYARITLISIDE